MHAAESLLPCMHLCPVPPLSLVGYWSLREVDIAATLWKAWSDANCAQQVTVNLDKLQEQKNSFVAYQQETASAIADREKVIERLKAELKALSDRLEGKTQELANCQRNVSVLDMQQRDAGAELQVRALSTLTGCLGAPCWQRLCLTPHALVQPRSTL